MKLPYLLESTFVAIIADINRFIQVLHLKIVTLLKFSKEVTRKNWGIG